jgi:hypothetical protein
LLNYCNERITPRAARIAPAVYPSTASLASEDHDEAQRARMCYRRGEVIMSNVSYQVEHIEGDIVHLRETYDLTDRAGPGILMRAGKQVDTAAEGIVSASRFIMMTREQAIQRGLIQRD